MSNTKSSIYKALGPGPATYPKGNLERVPGKQNWVDKVGGLPRYIERIASHIHYEKGKSIGHSIAIAVNAAKKMCASGDLNFNGKQNVNAGSRAAACAAIADWERKKAQARVSKGEIGSGSKWSDKRMASFLEKEVGITIQKCGDDEGGDCCDSCRSKKKETTSKTKKKKSSKVSKSISDTEFESLSSELDGQIGFRVIGKVEKRDDDKRLVFGWTSIAINVDGTEEVDKQGDVLEDIDQMEQVAYDFVLHSRDGGEMHTRKGVSTLIESFVSTPEKWEAMGIQPGVLPVGWWCGFKVNDEGVWKKVKDGTYSMFSVHGSGTRKALEE